MFDASFFNGKVRRELGDRREYKFQAYSGTDIKAVIYLPLITHKSANSEATIKFKEFATLQTLSISSTRSVAPVRVLGRSSPVGYTRGARTFGGTMVFATVNRDVFEDIYDVAIGENAFNASTSLVSDQLPPFTVVVNATNETGGAGVHVIHGITLLNYGTTYSVDDLYVETVYTFVATDATTLGVPRRLTIPDLNGRPGKTISQVVSESMGEAYGSERSIYDRSGSSLGLSTADEDIPPERR